MKDRFCQAWDIWVRGYDTSIITHFEVKYFTMEAGLRWDAKVMSMGILVNKYFSKLKGVLRCRRVTFFLQNHVYLKLTPNLLF